jgi:hypothetical protein
MTGACGRSGFYSDYPGGKVPQSRKLCNRTIPTVDDFFVGTAGTASKVCAPSPSPVVTRSARVGLGVAIFLPQNPVAATGPPFQCQRRNASVSISQKQTARFKGGPFMLQRAESVLTAGHFQQVITELGFHRALHDIDRSAEHYGVELFDHLAWAK